MSADTFKKVYTQMPDEIRETIFNMKEKAEELLAFFYKVDNREMSVAKTNLEQALMWATKAWVQVGDEINSNQTKENAA